jgi:hypothetical protein
MRYASVYSSRLVAVITDDYTALWRGYTGARLIGHRSKC